MEYVIRFDPFQFLIGRVKRHFAVVLTAMCLASFNSLQVESKACDSSTSCYSNSVSIPYRQSQKYITQVISKLCEFVSIPYRQSQKNSVWVLQGLQAPGFNSLQVESKGNKSITNIKLAGSFNSLQVESKVDIIVI